MKNTPISKSLSDSKSSYYGSGKDFYLKGIFDNVYLREAWILNLEGYWKVLGYGYR